MSKQVRKYPLETGVNEFRVPAFSKILGVKDQKGLMVLYLEVDTNEEKTQPLKILGVCTGTVFKVESGYEYIDTLMMLEDTFVVHFYHLFKSRGMGCKQ